MWGRLPHFSGVSMGVIKKLFGEAMNWHMPTALGWRPAGTILCGICGYTVPKGAKHKLVSDEKQRNSVVYQENGLERAKKIAKANDCSIIVGNTQEGMNDD